ncbi:MAG: hypothetical protein ACKO14_12645 [Armatimonadota bacterium]
MSCDVIALVTTIAAAGCIAPQLFATPQPPKGTAIVGRFTITNPGGSLNAEFRDRAKPIFEMAGPELKLRSTQLDLDARKARLEVSGKIIIKGTLTGPLKIVVKADDQTDTITCAGAVYTQADAKADAEILLQGDVRWVHLSPNVDGPAEMTGNGGKIVLRSGTAGPLIELGSGSFTATPKPPKTTPGKKP